VSGDEIERLKALYTQWGQGNFRDTSLWDERLVFERTGFSGVGVTGRWQGREAIGRAVRDWITGWAEWRIVGEDFQRLADGRILVLVRYVGRSREGDIQFDREGADIWTFEGERAIHLRTHWTRDELVAELRL
jgi:hypothetical protein